MSRRGYENRVEGCAGTASRAPTTRPPQPRIRVRSGGAHGPALLEALAAKDRPALRRAERHRGLFAALRAGSLGFRPHRSTAIRSSGATALGALRFACLAALRFVLEALVGKKHLLAGRKDKFRIAFRALQDLVVEFHEPPPLARASVGMSEPGTIGPGCGSGHDRGETGRTTPWA